jgi:uncharacterized coiled-coil DUF342 family protein
MPAPKVKATASNGSTASKSKAGKSSNGTSTPVPPSTTEEHQDTGHTGRPDKAVYDGEQEKLKKDIDNAQAKLSAVKDKISLATKNGTGNDRRAVLRAELDTIRGQQAGNKNSRTKIFEQLKTIQEGIQKKVKDLQAAKSKIPFKTVAEVDTHIKNLDKQVESGSLTLAAEKRALQDISTFKRNRRTVESFEADQESIEADRRAADELRKQLDDPESKAASDRYEAIKAELDELKKESDEAYAGRNKLFEERDLCQAELNTLFNAKRESTQRFRDANDRYWAKVNEDRARRAEKARAQRAAEEQSKKLEIAERLREEASLPAYQAEIEDCQTLIDYFSGKSSGNVTFASTPALLVPKKDVVGLAKLELRKVEAEPEPGLIVRKKKGDDDEAYFVGGKGKKSKKGGAKANGSSEAPTSSSSSASLNVPLPTLSALLSLSIPPPTATADVPRVVEDLKIKKAWFDANQSRVTAENITKAEADIKRLTSGAKSERRGDAPSSAAELVPSNGGVEHLESAATLKADDVLKTGEPNGEVQATLEEAQEQEGANGN